MSEGVFQKVVYSSLPDTREGKLKLLNAMGESTFKAAAMMQQAFPIVHVVKHIVNVNNEPVERVVLITDTGDTIAFVSEGMVQSIDRVIEVMGEPPWDPPLEMRVKEVHTRSGFKTYNLVLC